MCEPTLLAAKSYPSTSSNSTIPLERCPVTNDDDVVVHKLIPTCVDEVELQNFANFLGIDPKNFRVEHPSNLLPLTPQLSPAYKNGALWLLPEEKVLQQCLLDAEGVSQNSFPAEKYSTINYVLIATQSISPTTITVKQGSKTITHNYPFKAFTNIRLHVNPYLLIWHVARRLPQYRCEISFSLAVQQRPSLDSLFILINTIFYTWNHRKPAPKLSRRWSEELPDPTTTLPNSWKKRICSHCAEGGSTSSETENTAITETAYRERKAEISSWVNNWVLGVHPEDIGYDTLEGSDGTNAFKAVLDRGPQWQSVYRRQQQWSKARSGKKSKLSF